MIINILSAVDSRVILYPLIEALYPFGNIAVFSSNQNVAKLSAACDGAMRNVELYADPTVDLEQMLTDVEYDKDLYTFTIFDNVGNTEADKNIILLTAAQTPEYIQDVLYSITEDSIIFKFGKPAAPVKTPAKKPSEEIKPEEQDEFNKWETEKTDEELLEQAISSKTLKWIPYPTFDDIMLFESQYKFFKLNGDMCKTFYQMLKDYINVEERDFMKGVNKTDEGSSNIDTVYCR